MALYPAPLAAVGAMINGKPNWLLAGHLGSIGHDRVMVSLAKPHYTNRGIKASHALSINIVDEALLPKADYTGCVSGSRADKAEAFSYKIGEAGTPLIDAAPVSMSCTPEGKIDCRTLKPALFETPTYEYLRTGEVIGKCMRFGTQVKRREGERQND